MGADIDGEAAVFLVKSSSSAPSRNSTSVACQHLRHLAALARHEAEIETADARSRRVQHREAVPVALHRADSVGELGGIGENAAPSPRARAPCPMMIIGFLARFSLAANLLVPSTSSASVSGPAPRYS
jgi:hypothetical protein